ncbi:MAG: radical SAM protein [Deltaproteobacteria bacterium]|nr:radical SAM protein [Deltaproteobacteria bacterium]
MNVILVIPNSSYRFETNSYFSIESLGAAVLSGAFKEKGHCTRVVDAYALDLTALEVAAIATEDLDSRSVICLSFMQHTTSEASLIATEIRKIAPMAVIIGGGWGPTMAPAITKEVLSDIDIIVVGGDVISIVELVCESLSQPNATAKYSIVNTNMSLPTYQYFKQLGKAYHYILHDDDYEGVRKIPIPIISSIGCSWGRCTFCSTAARWGRGAWCGNNAENIVDELTELVERYEIKRVSFVDDSFFGPNIQGFRRAQSFVHLMKRAALPISFMLDCCVGDFDNRLFSELVDVGLSAVFIGIENISSDVLKRFGKKSDDIAIANTIEAIRELGIEIIPGYITFDPYMTIEEAIDSVQFIEETFPEISEEKLFNEIIPHVGTEYFSRLERDHMLRGKYPNYGIFYRDAKVWEYKNALQNAVIKKKRLQL